MSNMSYCRFRNTAADLRDCADHINDSVKRLGEDEHEARMQLIHYASCLLQEIGYSVEPPEGEIEFDADEEDDDDDE